MNITIPENAVTNAVAAAIERNPLLAGIVAGAAVATVTVLATPHLYRLACSGVAAVADTADGVASRIRGAFRRQPQPDMNKPGPTIAARRQPQPDMNKPGPTIAADDFVAEAIP